MKGPKECDDSATVGVPAGATGATYSTSGSKSVRGGSGTVRPKTVFMTRARIGGCFISEIAKQLLSIVASVR